jgi:hypothetical protein
MRYPKTRKNAKILELKKGSFSASAVEATIGKRSEK